MVLKNAKATNLQTKTMLKQQVIAKVVFFSTLQKVDAVFKI
jgi:hypothetical protein